MSTNLSDLAVTMTIGVTALLTKSGPFGDSTDPVAEGFPVNFTFGELNSEGNNWYADSITIDAGDTVTINLSALSNKYGSVNFYEVNGIAMANTGYADVSVDGTAQLWRGTNLDAELIQTANIGDPYEETDVTGPSVMMWTAPQDWLLTPGLTLTFTNTGYLVTQLKVFIVGKS